MNLQALLTFVRSHDCALDARIIDGTIYASSFWTDRDGNSGSTLERVGATLSECRDWLGY